MKPIREVPAQTGQAAREVAYLKYTTLTPVHTGTGLTWETGLHYFVQSHHETREKQVLILDPGKVYDALGKSMFETWCSKLELKKENNQIFDQLKNFTKSNFQHRTASELASLVVRCPFGEPGDSMREQDRDPVSGYPLLAGSGIKGAIRTSLYAKRLWKWKENGHSVKRQDIFGKKLEKKFLATDPNPGGHRGKTHHGKANFDWLRFLGPGDVRFERTECLPITLLNLVGYRNSNPDGKWSKKGSVGNFSVEVIPEGESGMGRMIVNTPGQKLAQNKRKLNTHLPQLSLKYILETLHQHTFELLEEELELFQERYDTDHFVQDYIENLTNLIEKAQYARKQGQFLIRVGWGQGWKGFTGGTVTEDDEEAWAEFEKRRIGGKKGWQPIRSKTRRVGPGQVPLGYMLIEIGDEQDWKKYLQGKAFPAAKVPALADEFVSPDRAGSPAPSVPSQELDPEPPFEPSPPKIEYNRKPINQIKKAMGEVLEANGRQHKVKVFVGQPGEEHLANLSYASGIPVGELIWVKPASIQKEKIVQVHFAGKVK